MGMAIQKAIGRSLGRIGRPFLSQREEELRLLLCQQLLYDLKHNSNRMIFFFDEKNFTVDSVYSKENVRVVCFGKADNSIMTVSKTKYPAFWMILGALVSTREKMPPFRFPVGYRLPTTHYLIVLKENVVP
uniref:Uncharacterized protein n=1 Tax=Lepeophtheirus salmonis TaxID=72036 RepID=A0A0K2URM6_LEPSM